jgi:hypothetical protein
VVVRFGCCVGSHEKWRQWVVPSVGSTMTVYGATSIAEAYNEMLDTVSEVENLDALVLLHDDLEVTDPDLRVKIDTVLSDLDVALVGVAGGRGAQTLAWWNYETVGHQMTDSGLLDFGERAGDVETLEGSFLVLSRWAIQNLRFDERYGGFHGYDDISYDALRLGKRVVVADIDTHHHTRLGWKSAECAEAWTAANEKFMEKWRR